MLGAFDTVPTTKREDRRFILLFFFGISLGFLESIVAIYLRQLHFPQGFSFPLPPLPPDVIAIESIREITTLAILFVVGIMAGKNRLERIAFFLYTFGIWDVFYYAGLKLFLDWPASVWTWDVLFLIPVVWTGPVLAPLICSATMILLAILIKFRQSRKFGFDVYPSEAVSCIAGALAILVAFIEDYARIILSGNFLPRFFYLANDEQFRQIISQYRPVQFNWVLFCVGECLILYALILWLRRNRGKPRWHYSSFFRF